MLYGLFHIQFESFCLCRVPENTTVVEYRIRQQLITEKGQAGEHGEQLTRKVIVRAKYFIAPSSDNNVCGSS